MLPLIARYASCVRQFAEVMATASPRHRLAVSSWSVVVQHCNSPAQTIREASYDPPMLCGMARMRWNHSSNLLFSGGIIMKCAPLASSTSFARRSLSSTTTSTSSTNTPMNDSSSSVEETLNKLFQESQLQQQVDAGSAVASSSGGADAWFSTATVVWEPTWYNLADQAIVAVRTFHDMTGIEYGWSIVGVTVILRLALFPLMIMAQQTTSRMAHVQPELNQIKRRFDAIGTPTRQDQLQFSKNMSALFTKYKVNPLRALLAPVIQLPLFMGMFFGLKKMPQLFPSELATGGMLWFPDLTQTDPYYILPFASAGTFLLLIEMGKEQMMAQQNPAQGQFMINMFRILALSMLPVCIYFESSMLVYWTANNILTMTQTATLKAPRVRSYFDIWDPPKPIPGMENPDSLSEAATKLIKSMQGEATTEQEIIRRHNQAVDAKKKAMELKHDLRKSGRPRGITGTMNR